MASTRSALDYNIGWIAPLPLESAAAWAMLDDRHEPPEDFTPDQVDDNNYDWGAMCGHNVVIATLSAGNYGTVQAAKTAMGMKASLAHISFRLLVGIGAGVPRPDCDVRLGDAVVSYPEATHGGVVQYDLGKSLSDDTWILKGYLAEPPAVVMSTLAKLRSRHESAEPHFHQFLGDAQALHKHWADGYRQPSEEDRLFKSECPNRGKKCENCQHESEIVRPQRASLGPKIHYGTVASGNTLVKNARIRDEIAERTGCICLEMEAAGLMKDYPCIVIRGICDYADAHKNDSWQRYAAAVASAVAKELIYYAPNARSRQEHKSDYSSQLSAIKADGPSRAAHVAQVLAALKTCPYEDRKNRNPEILPGTCGWFIEHPLYTAWKEISGAGLLWVTADPGCGKSTLSRHLVDKALVRAGRTICYFFFKDDYNDQKNSVWALRALLLQLFSLVPESTPANIREKTSNGDINWTHSVPQMWQLFLEVSQNPVFGEVICILDALDECLHDDRHKLIKDICDYYTLANSRNRMKFLVTSRQYLDIKESFHNVELRVPTIHLSGDNEVEAESISREIDFVIQSRIADFTAKRGLTPEDQQFLLDRFSRVPQQHRTYLWAHLTLLIIETTNGFTKGRARELVQELPEDLDAAYNKILSRSSSKKRAEMILKMILAANRPLYVGEICAAMAVRSHRQNFDDLLDYIEPDSRFEATLRNLCGLFIIIKPDKKVFLLHQSAREFLLAPGGKNVNADTSPSPPERRLTLEWKNCITHQEAHRVLAESCIWFINVSKSEQIEYDFRQYSDNNWTCHFSESNIKGHEASAKLVAAMCNPGSHEYWACKECLDSEMKADTSEMSMVQIATQLKLWAALEAYLVHSSTKILDSLTIANILSSATSQGRKNLAELALKAGANPNASIDGYVFRCHCVKKNKANFKKLLANVTGRLGLRDMRQSSASTIDHEQACNCQRYTAMLHIAAKRGDTPVMELLLKNGANVDALDLECNTALHFVAYALDLPACEILLAYKTNVMLKNDEGKTALQILCVTHQKCTEKTSSASMLFMLSEFKMGSVLRVKHDWTILHHAAKNDCLACIKYLVEKQMDLDAVTDKGCSALSIGLMTNRFGVVDYLLHAGAAVDIVDQDGNTALKYAICFQTVKQRIPLVKLLLAAGADITVRNQCGQTYVHIAALESDVYVLEFLLARGLSANASDNHGYSPLSSLCKSNARIAHPDLESKIRKLMEYGAYPSWEDVYCFPVLA